ncbi:MAG TPA: PTS transporter subunit EIIB [Bacilli bacterium]|nr:PTS transporter subunit EIIB [Bacilli bacterium]
MNEPIAIILMLIIVVPIILLTLFVFIRLFTKAIKANNKGITSDYEVGLIYDALGGKENIIEVKRELSRVTVTLKEPELIQKDQLQNIGATGILLVGNQVKFNFKEHAEAIEQLMK